MSTNNKCPRCLEIFSSNNNIRSCDNCDATYYSYNDYVGDYFVLFNFVKRGNRLLWFFKEKFCTYSFDGHKSIKLDWLPFNISADKFKNLLSFI